MADTDPIPLSSSLDGVVRSLRGPSRRAVSGVFDLIAVYWLLRRSRRVRAVEVLRSAETRKAS